MVFYFTQSKLINLAISGKETTRSTEPFSKLEEQILQPRMTDVTVKILAVVTNSFLSCPATIKSKTHWFQSQSTFYALQQRTPAVITPTTDNQ